MIQGPIAQLEEPPAHNRKVPGSNPGGPIRKKGDEFNMLPEDKERWVAQAGQRKSAPSGALFLFIKKNI